MTRLACRIRPYVILVVLFLPSLLPTHGNSADAFQAAAAADVFATALAFMAPRTLDPIPVSRLTLWGLNGLTALDPALMVSVENELLLLRGGGIILASMPLPADSDTAAWGSAAASIADAGWAASAAVRQAGSQAIITGFFDELFNHLDPYSRYVPPDDARTDLAKRDGSAGIGVMLDGPPGAVRISAVQPNEPAWAAGLQPGSRVLAVDGQSTARQTAETVSEWLDGPDGTDVTLIIADPRGRRRQVVIARALITPETVYADLRGGILMLHITSFSRDTDSRIEEELDAALTNGAKPRGVILDMRGNRGGLLRQAVLVADALLGGGVVTVTDGRDPRSLGDLARRP